MGRERIHMGRQGKGLSLWEKSRALAARVQISLQREDGPVLSRSFYFPGLALLSPAGAFWMAPCHLQESGWVGTDQDDITGRIRGLILAGGWGSEL